MQRALHHPTYEIIDTSNNERDYLLDIQYTGLLDLVQCLECNLQHVVGILQVHGHGLLIKECLDLPRQWLVPPGTRAEGTRESIESRLSDHRAP